MNGRDAIASAIASTATGKPAAPQRATVAVRLSTGRQVALNAPADMNAQEAIDLIGYVATQLPGELEKARAPKSTLVVARGRVDQ